MGAAAPDVVLHGRAGPVALVALRSQPLLLLFARGWAPGPGVPLEEIAGCLRGLGASLAVLSQHAAWLIRPDDAPERLAYRGATSGAALARLEREYGLHAGGLAPALFLVDERGSIRFASRGLPERDLERTVAEALRAATHATLEARRRAPRLWTRREWMATVAAALAATLVEGRPRAARAATGEAPRRIEGEVELTLRVNGEDRVVRVDPRVSLLDALRERLGLTGTKKGCDAGQCGACTLLLDGRRVVSCLTLALAAGGKRITTIEGLARGDALHPVQAEFLAHDAFQCGFCTPGQIMSAVGLLAEGHATADEEVREAMSGNVCRCGAYANILAAIQAARRRA